MHGPINIESNRHLLNKVKQKLTLRNDQESHKFWKVLWRAVRANLYGVLRISTARWDLAFWHK